jgi:hypothetical protein
MSSMTTAEFVDCQGLPPGSLLEVETRNRRYRIEYLGGTDIRISGHPELCPTPVPGQLRAGLIGRGQHLEFLLDDHRPVTTSRVLHLRVKRPAPTPSSVH